MARHVLTVLAVRDPDRAQRFYQEAFGWTPAVEVPVYRELQLPAGMRLGLYEREAFGQNTGRAPMLPPDGELAPGELYLYVDDPAAAAARAEAAGARLLSAAAPRLWGDEVAYLADPDGHVLALARPPAEDG